jgi:type VI secretion system protein ImpJ
MRPVPDPVRWYDDMLVTSRHVGQLSLRLESLVQALPGRLTPFFWGIARLDHVVDEGVLEVRSLEAVMPNGACVSLVEGQEELRLDLRAFASSSGMQRFFVHLATPVDEQDLDEPRRFVPGPRTGEVMRDDGLQVERRTRRLSLLAGEPPSHARYSSVPLLEITVEHGAPTLTDFIPPLLRVAAPWALAHQCATIAERLRGEIAVVAHGAAGDSQMPFPAEVRAQINPAVAAVPAFEVVLASAPHPFPLYLELCRLGGAVAALRNRVVPPSFPPYDHQDARACFAPVVRFLLGTGDLSAPAAAVPFAFDREGPWFRLPPDPLWNEALAPGSRLHMVLALQADMPEAQARQWGGNCVIATRGAIRPLLARRVLGLPRRPIAPYGALPSGPDRYLYRIEPDSQIARPGEDLLVLADLPGIRPAALTLYVVDAGEGSGHGRRA